MLLAHPHQHPNQAQPARDRIGSLGPPSSLSVRGCRSCEGIEPTVSPYYSKWLYYAVSSCQNTAVTRTAKPSQAKPSQAFHAGIRSKVCSQQPTQSPSPPLSGSIHCPPISDSEFKDLLAQLPVFVFHLRSCCSFAMGWTWLVGASSRQGRSSHARGQETS